MINIYKVILTITILSFSSNAFAYSNCPIDEVRLPTSYVDNLNNFVPRSDKITVSAEMFSQLASTGCYGRSRDTNTFTNEVINLIAESNKVVKNPLLFKSAIKNIILKIKEYSLIEKDLVRNIDTSKAWAAFIQELDTALLPQSIEEKDWNVNNDSLVGNITPKYSGLDIISEQCPSVWQGDECLQAIKESGRLFRALNLMEQVFHLDGIPTLNEQIAFVKNRLKGFKSYYEKAEPLWIWELPVNNKIFTAKDNVLNGNLLGFREPVSHQILYFHPTTAMLYVPDQEAKFKPAILVDIIGYNWLKWKNQNTDLDSFGGSAIISLSEFQGKTNIGWGFRFFYNRNYSFGVTKNSDQVGLFFSIGAVEKVNGWAEKQSTFIDSYNNINSKF